MPDLFTPDWRSASNLVGSPGSSPSPLPASATPGLLGTHKYVEKVHGITCPFVCEGAVGYRSEAHRVEASEAEPIHAILMAYDELRLAQTGQPLFETVTRLVCSSCSRALLADEVPPGCKPILTDADAMEVEEQEPRMRHHADCPRSTIQERPREVARARHAKSASSKSAVPATCWCTRHEHMSKGVR